MDYRPIIIITGLIIIGVIAYFIYKYYNKKKTIVENNSDNSLPAICKVHCDFKDISFDLKDSHISRANLDVTVEGKLIYGVAYTVNPSYKWIAVMPNFSGDVGYTLKCGAIAFPNCNICTLDLKDVKSWIDVPSIEYVHMLTNLIDNYKVSVCVGHSAGSQFLLRCATYLTLPVPLACANAGSYCFPNSDPYPYGSPSNLSAYLDNQVSLFLGMCDVSDNCKFDKKLAANKQGKNRLERGRNFYNAIMSNKKNATFTMSLVPNVGHDDIAMFVYIGNIILNLGSRPLPPTQTCLCPPIK